MAIEEWKKPNKEALAMSIHIRTAQAYVNRYNGKEERLLFFSYKANLKHRQVNGRYTIVSMTNEHRSLQNLCFLLPEFQRPKTCKLIKGKWKVVSVNGSSLCMNPECFAYRHRYNTANHDKQAAFAIEFAGASRISTRQTLEPFNASLSKVGRQFCRCSPPANVA
jgi:hypothetical protein